MRLRTQIVAVLGALAVVAVAVPAAATDPSATSRCAAPQVRGSWLASTLPLSGPRRFLAPDPELADRIYAADERDLLRSTDSGCSWARVFRAPDGVRLAGVRLVAASTLVLAAVEGEGGLARPLAWIGDPRAGAPFAEWSSGLPLLADVRALAAAADGTVVLAVEPPAAQQADPLPGVPVPPAVVTPPADPGRARLYAARPGQGWAALPAAGLPGPVDALAADPASPRVLWVVSAGRLLRTTDAASTFGALAPELGKVRDVTVAAPDLVLATGSAAGAVSVDGGRRFRTLATAAGTLVAARSDDDGALVRTDTGRLLRVRRSDGSTADVSPGRAGDPLALGVAGGRDRTRPGAYLVATTSGLLRARPPAAELGGGVVPDAVGAPGPGTLTGPAPARRGQLAPERQSVVLRPGQRREVPLTLTVPPTPTPVDLFFVVDTSDSMTPVLDDLRANVLVLVERLVAQGVSLHVGLAVTGTERADGAVDPPADALDPGYRPPVQYRLLRPVGPPDAGFRAALDGLRSETTPPGSARRFNQLAGLWQALTGTGIPGAAPGVRDVPPGQRAGWRTGRVRHVLVDATDTSLRAERTRGTPTGPDGAPDLDRVAAELQRQRVAHLGLVLDSQPELVRDLGRLSAATGAHAGPAGVDCDGDGVAEVRPRDPLVCATTNGFTDGVSAALHALPDLVDLSVRVAGAASAGRPVLLTRRLDVLAGSVLPLRVPVSCDAEPGVRVAEVVAALAGTPLATARVEVRCLPAAVPAIAGLAPAAPAAPRAPLPPPGVPPPAVQPPPPPAQPVGQPQPVAQGAVQPGVAAQQEEQPQLALATADLTHELDPALSASSDDRPAPALPLAAGLVTGAAAWAVRRRTAAGPAYVRR